MLWIIRLLLCSMMLNPLSGVNLLSSRDTQDQPPISKVTLEYDFGTILRINAEISQPMNFSSFVLILQPDGQSSRQIGFTPEADGQISIAYDLGKDALKPFARIYYWFELVRTDGTSITTPSYWFDYLDNRFTWKTNDSELFLIAWVDGDASFGQKLQEIAREGLKKATTLLPVAPRLPIRIYVYPDVNSLQEALTLTGQPWTAGHASPDIGVILVSNDSPSAELIEMERQIPHELMHILEFQLVKEQFNAIPTWLSEGLASSAELYPNPDLQRVLNENQAGGSLLSLESLCNGFPQEAKSAQLAYAQSASFVSYLNERFGSQVFQNLLENSATGQTCTHSVESVTQVTLNQLQQDWLKAAYAGSQSVSPLKSMLPYLLLGGVLILAAVIVLLRLNHSRERKSDAR